MIEELTGFMQSKGYQRMITSVQGLIFFFRQEMQSVNVVITMEFRDGSYLIPEQYLLIKQQMREAFEKRGVGEMHAMGLAITSEPETARVLCEEERFCWLIDKKSGRLIIYENQAVDFYGLKAMLEEFLTAWNQVAFESRETDGCGRYTNNCGMDTSYGKRTDRFGTGYRNEAAGQAHERQGPQKMPILTILLVTVNCVIFLICTWGGGVLYNKGELLGLSVVEQGEYYRICTSMFLHADTGHLFSNMLMLYAVGSMLEKRLGCLRYVLLYFLSGIGAAAVSMWHQMQIGSTVGSIGASGAIYGLIGALFVLVIVGKGRFQSVTLTRMLLCIAYSLYSGLISEHVDNAAHIGGFFCGIILTALLMINKSVKHPSGSADT